MNKRNVRIYHSLKLQNDQFKELGRESVQYQHPNRGKHCFGTRQRRTGKRRTKALRHGMYKQI